MPSAFREPKNLPEWLQLDFFRRHRLLGRWKQALIWGTLAAFVVGSAVAFFVPRSARLLQAGPVSAAHGFFNHDCAQCHTEAFQTARRLVRWDGTVRAVPNEACVRCHDGPPHNKHQTVDLDCSACHREHRGRPVLARVPDADCTACHADLKANHAKPDVCNFEDVTRFPGGHPEFALWREELAVDPGQLHFNHSVHLNGDGLLQPDGKKIVMECSACHQVDPAGRYMQPINYERHCQSCHPLTVRLAGRFDTPELRASAEAFAKEPAPHREPKIVRGVLRERLIDWAQGLQIVKKADDDEDFVFPKARRMQPVTERQWTWAKRELGEMEKVLFFTDQLPENERPLFQLSGGCRYCHIEKQKGADGLPEFLKTSLRDRWLPHSRFRHEAHRTLTCTECHDARTSKLTSDVLMPKIATCVRCHNATAGARHDCVECHQYHHRAGDYVPPKGRSIAESLGEGK